MGVLAAETGPLIVLLLAGGVVAGRPVPLCRMISTYAVRRACEPLHATPVAHRITHAVRVCDLAGMIGAGQALLTRN